MQAQTCTNSRPELQGHRAISPRSDPTVWSCGPAWAVPSLRGGSKAAQPQVPWGLQALWLCRSRGLWLESQAGCVSLLFLSTFGEGISSFPGPAGQVSTQMESPTQGPPKGELTMETPRGARQTQGQVATGRPYRGQGHSPASWEGRGQRGLQLDILSQAQNNVHTYMQSKEWLSVSISR